MLAHASFSSLPPEMLMHILNHNGELRMWPHDEQIRENMFRWQRVCKYWRACLRGVVIRRQSVPTLIRCGGKALICRELTKLKKSLSKPIAMRRANAWDWYFQIPRHPNDDDFLWNREFGGAIGKNFQRLYYTDAMPCIWDFAKTCLATKTPEFYLYYSFAEGVRQKSASRLEAVLDIVGPMADFDVWFYSTIVRAIDTGQDEAVALLLREARKRPPFPACPYQQKMRAGLDKSLLQGEYYGPVTYPENVNFLFECALLGGCSSITRRLIEAGADVNRPIRITFPQTGEDPEMRIGLIRLVMTHLDMNPPKWTSLMRTVPRVWVSAITIAVALGRAEQDVIKVLLEAGADPNQSHPSKDVTARSLALKLRSWKVCRVLGISEDEIEGRDRT